MNLGHPIEGCANPLHSGHIMTGFKAGHDNPPNYGFCSLFVGYANPVMNPLFRRF